MNQPGTARPMWLRFGVAALFPFAALGLRLLLTPLLQDQSPLMLFILSGAAAAWWGGFWPGLMAYVMGLALAAWFFIAPVYGWEIASVPERTRMASYLIVGVVISAMAEALHRAKNAAEAANRAKDEFLATLSHELRTPLNPVLLAASVSATDPALPEEEREQWSMVRRNITLQARLIDDLLDLTRATRGKMSVRLVPVDAHRVLMESVTTIRTDAAAKRQELKINLDAERTRVEADAGRLQQVLWNVLKNAIKFTPEAGTIRVETSNPDDHGHLRIAIHDTGEGMTEAELGRIFNPFEQGDHALPRSAHRHGGLGLGLAISRELMTLHGGRIWAESEGKGRGAVFFVELPVRGK